MYERAEACRGKGSPIEPEDFATPYDVLLRNILDQANALFESLRSATKREWRERPFHIVFTDGKMMSACYRRLSNIDYIIVPVGALERVGGATMGIMAEPSFCPRIGDVSLESGIDKDLTRGFPPFPMLHNDHGEDVELSVVWPNCSTRASYGQLLMESAILYMIMHEMGHIFGGHLDSDSATSGHFCEMSFGADILDTCGETPNIVKEIDADMFAMFVHSEIEMSKQLSESLYSIFPWKGLNAGQAAFVTIANTIGILFRLSERKAWAFPEASQTHPAPIVRTAFALGNMMSCCINAGLLVERDGPRLVIPSVRDIDRVWQLHKLPGYQKFKTKDWTRNISGLCDQLHQQYEKFKPILAEKARLGRV